MFTIYDGRKEFYQWDKDRKLIVEDETITQVHFATCLCAQAQVCEVRTEEGLRVADVPNELLTKDTDIRVWAYDGASTKHEAVFDIVKRTKPADYIYTPTEVWTVEKAVEEALEEAKESGDFKGDKGEKGDAGAINFIVVAELPEVGSGDSIYLVPNAIGENNNFEEYVWQNGAWELIGSAGVEVNLEDYVKNTDYATSSGASGVVKVDAAKYGIGCNEDGYLVIAQAGSADIDNWQNYTRPITPNNLDYAVKKALAHTNHTTWTDDEKKAAREQIGVGIADYTNVGLVKPASWYGIIIDTNVTLNLVNTQEAHINNRKGTGQVVAITTAILDYAVKQALTNPLNTTWTEEEKASARALLGIE